MTQQHLHLSVCLVIPLTCLGLAIAALVAPADVRAAPIPQADDGRFTRFNNAVGACDTHVDCAAGQSCLLGRCRSVGCSPDNPCPAGTTCTANQCQPMRCSDTADCPIERQCHGGRCVLPQPGPASSAAQAGPKGRPSAGARFLFGTSFPVGVAAAGWFTVGGSIDVGAALGTPLVSSGVGGALSMRVRQKQTTHFGFDMLYGLAAVSAGPYVDQVSRSFLSRAALGATLGTGRFLLEPTQDVRALWVVAGLGFEWWHGADLRRVLRLEVVVDVLIAGDLRADVPVGVWPGLSLQYGFRP